MTHLSIIYTDGREEVVRVPVPFQTYLQVSDPAPPAGPYYPERTEVLEVTHTTFKLERLEHPEPVPKTTYRYVQVAP